MAGTSFGTNTSLTVTNLQSLGDNSFWQSAKIDNTDGLWAEVFLTIVTTTTAGDAIGRVDIYIAGSNDGGTDFAGGATGTEGTYTDSANTRVAQLRQVGSMTIDASETTARTLKFQVAVQDLPEDFAIVLGNQTGTAIASSGNAVEYRLNKIA